MRKVICECCKKEFIGARSNAKTCSKQCKSIRNAEQNRIRYIERDHEVVKLDPRDHLCDYGMETYKSGV